MRFNFPCFKCSHVYFFNICTRYLFFYIDCMDLLMFVEQAIQIIVHTNHHGMMDVYSLRWWIEWKENMRVINRQMETGDKQAFQLGSPVNCVWGTAVIGHPHAGQVHSFLCTIMYFVDTHFKSGHSKILPSHSVCSNEPGIHQISLWSHITVSRILFYFQQKTPFTIRLGYKLNSNQASCNLTKELSYWTIKIKYSL